MEFCRCFFLLTRHYVIGWLFPSSMNVFSLFFSFFFFVEFFPDISLCNIFYLQIVLAGVFYTVGIIE